MEMQVTASPIGATTASRTDATLRGIGTRLLAFYAAVVVIQTVHLAEHVIQLFQVYALGVPDDDALGLLGYIYQFQGTEEWLHLAFNAVYFASLALIAAGLLRSPALRSTVPILVLGAFLFFGLWLEGWHVIEHLVIISNVVANDGCPCPGIVDARLGVSDTVLHLVYNTIAYVATVLPLMYVFRARLRAGAGPKD
jgi:hypothetical protein